MTHTIYNSHAVRVIGTPGTWAASAAYGNWVNTLGYRRAFFIAQNGELDANMDVKPYQATSAAGAGAKAVTTTAAGTSVNGSFVNGVDEGRALLFEIRTADLSAGFNFVTLQVTPGATDSYSAVVLLGEPYDSGNITNGTADGITAIKAD